MENNEKTKSKDEITITVQGLNVWTPEEKAWWRTKPTKEKTVILNNGIIKQGEFTAVLGPSGAGKTTFLVSLAGKCTLPCEGTVLLNGTNVRDLKAVEIVPQFEVFLDGLTVMEHLVFMTEMKLGSSSSPLNQSILRSLLQELKLETLAESRICELSGGERRLLSLATCLLSSPQILVSDEPTTGLDSYNALLVIQTLKKLSKSGKTVICSIHQPSCNIFKEFDTLMLMAEGKMVFHGTLEQCKAVFERPSEKIILNNDETQIKLLSSPQILVSDEPTTGLDSYNALLVIQTLKKLSKSGKTVICSIHQPSCNIFKEFDTLMLMAEGKMVFHGTLEQCKAVFESIGLHCPLNYNPAEFYIRAVSNSSQNYIQVMEKYRDLSLKCPRTSLDSSLGHQLTQRNWFKQVHLLLWRQSLTFKRNVKSHIAQLIISVMVTALVIGTCYIGVTGTTQRGIQDIRGFLWLITSEICFCLSYNALYVFENEMPLFRREVGVYKCSAYFVARFLSFIPRCIIWSVTLVTLATMAVDLPNHVVTTMEFIVALFVASIGAFAYGLGMAALFTSTGIMGDVMPCTDLPLFLMSGAFLRISSLPIWLYPVKFLSHFYYAMDAISNIYWRQISEIDCPWNSTSSCIKDGASVLMETGYSEDFIFQDSLGILGVTIFWGLLGYCGLKREEKKGYAY